MSRRKRKAPGKATGVRAQADIRVIDTALVAPHHTTAQHVHALHSIWVLAPSYTATALLALTLSIIPYGAPVAAWYMWIWSASAVSFGLSLALDPLRRWRALSYWPVLVILGVWGCSIGTCAFPQEVLDRSWSMAYFSVLFFAAQAVTWSSRCLRLFVLSVLLTVLLVTVDLWWQRITTRSLIREVRAPIVRAGDQWVFSETHGSQGNRNDHAVVPVLLPLCTAVLSTRWAWGLVLIGGIASAYEAAAVKSRQFVLGLCTGLGSVCGMQFSSKVRWLLVGAIVLAVGLTVLIHPNTRSRFLQMSSDPLSGRAIPIVYGTALFLGNPVFGVGPSLYGHYYVVGVREGWTYQGTPLTPTGMPWVHSLPVEVACETGLAGVVGSASVLWAFARRLRKSLRIGGATRTFGIAVMGAALSMGVMALIDLAFIKDWVRICWWLLLGLGFAAPTLQGPQVPKEGATLSQSNGL